MHPNSYHVHCRDSDQIGTPLIVISNTSISYKSYQLAIHVLIIAIPIIIKSDQSLTNIERRICSKDV